MPQTKSAPAIVLLILGGACLALLTYRALRTYMLTRRFADLTVAVGCVWLGVTLWTNLIIGFMTVGYLVGHVLEIAAVLLVTVPAALDIKRAGASRPLVGDLTATELVASEEAYLGPRVRALMVQLEQRDVSTEEHTRRVALLAARVGEELRLSATARRHLAVGGLLHDIGKLAVPLDILNKPGKLTDEEFAAIKRHPSDGRKLLEELGGFPEPVRGLVSDHHERLDGSGYPRGLRADELCVETRILAVVDVYDALVSDRVYRAAWSPERAFGLLEDESARVRPDRRRRAHSASSAARRRRRSPRASPTSAPAPVDAARRRARPPRVRLKSSVDAVAVRRCGSHKIASGRSHGGSLELRARCCWGCSCSRCRWRRCGLLRSDRSRRRGRRSPDAGDRAASGRPRAGTRRPRVAGDAARVTRRPDAAARSASSPRARRAPRGAAARRATGLPPLRDAAAGVHGRLRDRPTAACSPTSPAPPGRRGRCRGRVLSLCGASANLAFTARTTLRGGLDLPWAELLAASRAIRALAREARGLARERRAGERPAGRAPPAPSQPRGAVATA